MATKIRLLKVGRHKLNIFRIIVTDSRRNNSGKYIEKIGVFNPKDDEIVINKESIKKWISKGAIVSGAVKGVLRKKKINLMELCHE